jgi:tetratricopeptide (TPR) repeat protein
MKSVCFYLLLCIPFISFAQSGPKPVPMQKKAADVVKDIDEKIYAKAIRYGDFLVAKQALYSLMAKYPERTNYLDSLMRLYFSVGNYAQCILAGKDYMLTNPDNMMSLEMIAISENSLERYKDALADYEKLYAKSSNLFHAYQIAVINYTLKRYEESKMVQSEIINNPKSAKDSMQIMIDAKDSQYVPYKAAAYNLRGVTQKDLRLFEEAKLSFEEALKITPNFRLAKNNLEALKNPEPKAPETLSPNKPVNSPDTRIQDTK